MRGEDRQGPHFLVIAAFRAQGSLGQLSAISCHYDSSARCSARPQSEVDPVRMCGRLRGKAPRGVCNAVVICGCTIAPGG
jgi:hypothetical protein